MGYQTYFTLNIQPEPNESILQEELYGGTIEELVNGHWDSCKWYDHNDDMIEISKKYPEYLFTLDGEGEENDDIWRSFYRNGQSYDWRLEVIWPEFEESKLQ